MGKGQGKGTSSAGLDPELTLTSGVLFINFTCNTPTFSPTAPIFLLSNEVKGAGSFEPPGPQGVELESENHLVLQQS